MSKPFTPPTQKSLSHDIAGQIRAAILSGHFGPGEHLREEQLARQMDVSRGPIREAFQLLEREGLVVIRRNRGVLVARLSLEDLNEVYTLRVAIEQLAVERAAQRINPEELAALEAVVQDIKTAYARGITEQEGAELDLVFHDLIYDAAHHRRLRESWNQLRPQIHVLLLSRNVASDDFRDLVVTSHQDILNALRDRDPGLAVTLITEHLRGSYERVARSYDFALQNQEERA